MWQVKKHVSGTLCCAIFVQVLLFDRTNNTRAFLGIHEQAKELQKHFGDSVELKVHATEGGNLRKQEEHFM